MNINECGCQPHGWPRPWWWSVYPRDTPTVYPTSLQKTRRARIIWSPSTCVAFMHWMHESYEFNFTLNCQCEAWLSPTFPHKFDAYSGTKWGKTFCGISFNFERVNYRYLLASHGTLVLCCKTSHNKQVEKTRKSLPWIHLCDELRFKVVQYKIINEIHFGGNSSS